MRQLATELMEEKSDGRNYMLMKALISVQIERKNPNAWANLKKLGKALSKAWKAEAPSWELVSTSRR